MRYPKPYVMPGHRMAHNEFVDYVSLLGSNTSILAPFKSLLSLMTNSGFFAEPERAAEWWFATGATALRNRIRPNLRGVIDAFYDSMGPHSSYMRVRVNRFSHGGAVYSGVGANDVIAMAELAFDELMQRERDTGGFDGMASMMHYLGDWSLPMLKCVTCGSTAAAKPMTPNIPKKLMPQTYRFWFNDDTTTTEALAKWGPLAICAGICGHCAKKCGTCGSLFLSVLSSVEEAEILSVQKQCLSCGSDSLVRIERLKMSPRDLRRSRARFHTL